MADQFESELSQKRSLTGKVIADLLEKLDKAAVMEQDPTIPPDHADEDQSPVDSLFLEQLASPDPTPAGGAAAAYAGACAASLIMMAARITANNPKYISEKSRMLEIINQAGILRLELYRALQEDSNAYNNFLAVYNLSVDNDDEKVYHAAELEKARAETIHIPLQVAQKCMELINLAMICIQEGSFSTTSDSNTADLLAESALRASLNNALFNLRGSTDEKFTAHVQESISRLIDQMSIKRELIQEVFYNRTGIKIS